MGVIDKKLDLVYNYIDKYVSTNGFSPSVREICKDCNIKSTATAYYYLEKLQARGLITKQSSKNRTVGVSRKNSADYLSIPVIGEVTAGTPILAVENFEEYCAVPTEFKTDEDLFMLHVRGTSMIEAGIFDGDKIIVKKQSTAKNGDIVVAFFDDAATVKRFYKYPDKIVLHPENSTMSDIVLPDVDILGVVTGLIRKF